MDSENEGCSSSSLFKDRNVNQNDNTTNDGSMETSEIRNLLAKDKKDASAIIYAAVSQGLNTVPSLDDIMDYLFNPEQGIDNSENISWVSWLIAGGLTPEEFASIVRSYDNRAKCGLVWVPHVVAYRCRTCGISPCMSICRDCFKKGDHKDHDFNMFLSQAGGACDCGDTSVMKAEGFCSDHGLNKHASRVPIPRNLLSIAEAIMPKLLFRLLHHYRQNGHQLTKMRCHKYITFPTEEFVNMLKNLNNIGEVMRRVMTKTLMDPDVNKLIIQY